MSRIPKTSALRGLRVLAFAAFPLTALVASAAPAVDLYDGDDWLASSNFSRNNGGLANNLSERIQADGTILGTVNGVPATTHRIVTPFVLGDGGDVDTTTANENWTGLASNANALAFQTASPSGFFFGGSKIVLNTAAAYTGVLSFASTYGVTGGASGGASRDFIRAGTNANLPTATDGAHTGSIQTLFLWRQSEFLAPYNTGTVDISAGGTFRASGYAYRGDGGLDSPTRFIDMSARWVVQIGSQLYATDSTYAFASRAGGFVSPADDGYAGSDVVTGGLGGLQWRPLTVNPADSTTSDPLVSLGAPEMIALTGVTGVGMLLDSAFSVPAGTYQQRITDFEFSPIPEPSTYAALAGLGALGLAFWRRRR